MAIKIIGTSAKVPKFVLTNEKLSKIVETSDEWIVERTGIKERRIFTDETLTDLTKEAIIAALADAGKTKDDVDLLIVSTLGADYITPSLSMLVQKDLEMSVPAYDINNACSGFVYALNMAEAFIEAKKSKCALVVCAEQLSRRTNYEDRGTCILFGDGVGAIVVEEGQDEAFFDFIVLPESDKLYAKTSDGNMPYKENSKDGSYIVMDGQEVYKFAVSKVTESIERVLKKANMTIDEIDYILLHQANMRILKTIEKNLGAKEGVVLSNLEKYGNTSSATVPILLHESLKSNTIKSGHTVIFSAFGAGLSVGSCIYKI